MIVLYVLILKKLYFFPCKHGVCRECLIELEKVSNKCPECRATFKGKYDSKSYLLISEQIKRSKTDIENLIDSFTCYDQYNSLSEAIYIMTFNSNVNRQWITDKINEFHNKAKMLKKHEDMMKKRERIKNNINSAMNMKKYDDEINEKNKLMRKEKRINERINDYQLIMEKEERKLMMQEDKEDILVKELKNRIREIKLMRNEDINITPYVIEIEKRNEIKNLNREAALKKASIVKNEYTPKVMKIQTKKKNIIIEEDEIKPVPVKTLKMIQKEELLLQRKIERKNIFYSNKKCSADRLLI